MGEQSIRYQQQKELKNLVDEFTKKQDLAWETEDNKKIKIAEDFANEYCQRLIELFNKNSSFRPHYSFMHEYTVNEELRSTDIGRIINNISHLQVILNNVIGGKNVCSHHLGLQKYQKDRNIQFAIDMFFSSLCYEFDLVNISKLTKEQSDIRMMLEQQIQQYKALSVTMETQMESKYKALSAEYEDLAANMESKYKTLSVNMKEQYNDLSTEASKITTNMLTVLGIFVSIIVAVVASYLSKVVDLNVTLNLNGLGKCVYTLISGQILFNVIFLLMFMIARLTGKTVSSPCPKPYDECTEKDENGNMRCKSSQCGPYKRAKNKFPYIFAINAIFVIGYIICLIYGYITRFDSDNASKFLKAIPTGSVIALGIIIIAIILLFVLRPSGFINKIKQCRKKTAPGEQKSQGKDIHM